MIEWYYLGAFNEDYSKLLHVWRIPAKDFGEEIQKGFLYINVNNTEKMKEYEITDKFN